MLRYPIGTYYNFKISIEAKNLKLDEYDRLYKIISQPKDKHIITLPFNQGSITFDGYITSGSHKLLKIYKGKNYWGELSFNVIASSPQVRP